MVTRVLETGARPQELPRKGKKMWSKVTYIIGLGCCMKERKPKSSNPPSSPPASMSETKHGNVNWSTSTLGLETELSFRSEEGLPSDIPLSSFEFYPPTPTSPPTAARKQSRSQRGTEDPVITITDYDIASGTTPSIGECQREKQARKVKSSRRKHKKSKNYDPEKNSTVQAWSQIDPMYGIYQADRERDQRLSRATTSTTQRSSGRYSDIRAFDFMSYGGWIVV